MLDVKRLRILREVVAQGSFSAAADTLYLSQSAVSQQIATLEREVGMTLLERTRDGTKPTDAGRVLVAHADAAICRLDEAERELAQIAGLEGGEIRIASFPSASATLLTLAVSDFVRRHPKVKLRVADAEPEVSLPKLRAGDLDLAITFDYPSLPEPEERDVEHTLLLTESMHVALPIDHPLAAKASVRMTDLADEDWLSGGCPSSCGLIVSEACREAGFEPRIGFESDDYHVLQGFIAAGLGVTLLPDLALHTLRKDVVVRPTEPEAPMRRVFAATRKTRSAATDAMLTSLVEAGERFARQTAVRLEAVA
ncbi:MAG: LysR substrate-binding domain-containing protein [Actinomycetota bacterium]|nr:LysR substrate-binding domain-containing protein [Actinomycetota bacterium]